MTAIRRYRPLLTVLSLAVLWPALGPASAEDRITTDANGHVKVTPLPMDAAFKNQGWTPEMEKEFWERANASIAQYKITAYGNTYGENEKSSFAKAMFSFLGGQREPALKFLQDTGGDPGADCGGGKTDYYWCFTIKQQARKYFFFGEYLSEAHRKQMFEDAKAWTATDPAKRAHPTGKGSGNSVWGPEKTKVCVDTRNTDNLRAMRLTSIYLFAEETGNKAVAEQYKQRLLQDVYTMYCTGHGEWDSQNYLGHTATAWLNLYDFAKDPQVRLAGKAALDWVFTTAAAKYYRGGWVGPNKRDYGGSFRPWGGNAERDFGLYFGDCPVENPSPGYDEYMFMTSSYRPPAAVVALARKQFAQPVEQLNTKPPYGDWNPAPTAKPAFYETMYYGRTFVLGSLANGGGGDVGAFKLGCFNSQTGVDMLSVNAGVTYEPKDFNKKLCQTNDAPTQIAQYRNLVIWLRQGEGPFLFCLPKTVGVQRVGDLWVLKFEKSWAAIRPINLAIDAEAQPPFPEPPADPKNKNAPKRDSSFDELAIYAAKGTGPYCGFAMQVGEGPEFADAAAFVAAVQGGMKVDTAKLSAGEVTLTGAGTAGTLKLVYSPPQQGQDAAGKPTSSYPPPQVWRNGVARDYAKETDIYKPAQGTVGITVPRMAGTLRVEAGGKVFTCSVTKDGKVTFDEK